MYVLSVSIVSVSTDGVADGVQLVNWSGGALFLGTAMYAFEGIAMVIPLSETIHPSIRHKFPALLAKVGC